MKHLLIALVLTLFAALPAAAQTGAITQYALAVYQPGVNNQTGAAFQTNVIPAASVTCNQVKPVPPAVVANPATVFWDDPSNVGKACIVNQGTFLLALPIPSPQGAYTATITATNDFGLTSARSLGSNPFYRATNPAAPTGVGVN